MFLWFFSAVAVMLAFMAPPSEGTGRAIITLRRYTNPTHRLSNGKCCDHRFLNFGPCRPCDAYFKLCVSQSVSGSPSNSCNIGRGRTGVVGDNDNHVLNIRRAFSFDSFLGAITISVQVWDKDKYTSNDYVGCPSKTLQSVTPGSYWDPLRRSLTLKSSYVTMKLDLELYCDKDYYGPSCSVRCVPRDDSSGHYTCDNLGNKICLQHWEGPSCNRCERNWFGPRCSTFCDPRDNDVQGHYKCRPSDGKKECLPSWFGSDCRAQCIPRDDDSGHYSCAQDGSKTCLPGWYGETCTVFCVPQNDEKLGNYTCNDEGNMVCLDGVSRLDSNCSWTCLAQEEPVTYNCTEEGYKICHLSWFGSDCATYCEPHNDKVHGYYTCNARDGSKVCLEGWEGRDCRDRSVESLFTIE